MKLKILFVMALVLFVAATGLTQTPTGTPVTEPDHNAEIEAARQIGRQRRDSQMAFDQLRDMDERKIQADVVLLRNRNGVIAKYNPRLTGEDIRSISISPDDLKTYSAFLKGSKSGILRLQDAVVCLPNNMVYQASGLCPNNISGKATAYSFRAQHYSIPAIADIFFKNGRIATSGLFVIGIYSDFGDEDIFKLNPKTAAIAELNAFKLSRSGDEVERQFPVLQQGVKIGDRVYKTESKVVVGNTYVLRAIAYNVRSSNFSKKTIKMLVDDQRKEVTIALKVIRQMDDGSIVLLCKELNRTESPTITIKAKNKN